MKKNDLYFLLFVMALFLPFITIDSLFRWYTEFNLNHGLIMSFFKFAILATMGEALGLRIKTGVYNAPGFGLIPRAIVWGFLGITIKIAFIIFTNGSISLLGYIGFTSAPEIFAGNLSWGKLLIAFTISTTMNLTYAPIMMSLHKITDTHILNHGGTIPGLFKPISVGQILTGINWDVMWNFVFKKTIPFFWIPAHTITFLLPEQFQVLFAAILGIALGVILAVAAVMGRNK
ncbi:MAG: Mpv17/PMP22 family protein [Bacteroidales bacterium]|nr:Mpv17/PMP22 family protein [Bacteroidales bacterium]